MRKYIVVFCMLLGSTAPAAAQVSFGIETPGVSIGINVPTYPQLVPVPGYPVYYAPQMNSNYFFYDGMYWVYQGDNWYASTWYNGPWALVGPEVVPFFVLRVPVRYYRRPPVYFHGWSSNAPPRWGEHWGNAWAQNRQGWDNWNRSSVPAPAPLPLYQRQYSGNKYPRAEQQPVIQSQNYHYQPRDAVVQQRYQAQHIEAVPAAAPKVTQGVPQERRAQQQQQQQQATGQQKAQQEQQAEAAQNAQQLQAAGQQRAQQQQAAGQQKAQQEQQAAQKTQQQREQQQAAAQQKVQQQQATAQQKAQKQQQQEAAAQQKTQQQQQQQAAAQQKAQQQQQGAAQQKAQQQQQQQAAVQQRAQQQQQQKQAPAPREEKPAKQPPEKGEPAGGERQK